MRHLIGMKIEIIKDKYKDIQQRACNIIEMADDKGKFSKDEWKKDIGTGLTRVMQNGNVIEKAAINFSEVSGSFSQEMAAMAGKEGRYFNATGVSSIIHPSNPHVPIIHMNIRYFELDTGESWFGGGIDLTPHYIVEGDAISFHQQLKNICDKYHPDFYDRYKKWADDYFFLKHRNEARGVGGIFFDQVEPGVDLKFENLLNYTIDLGNIYPEIYAGFMKNNGNLPYTEKEKEWQLIRRGRYAEFNLVYDRGTRFGLASDGNTESILVSMPPEVRWKYDYTLDENSPELRTLQMLKKEIDWVGK